MNIYLNGYINGLVSMTSSISKRIGCSFIQAYCFNKKDFKIEFCKQYKIKDFTLELVEKDYLNTYLEEDIIDKLFYWVRFEMGDYNNCYTIDNTELKNTIFYFIDDIVVFEYKKFMLCFIIGNNE